MLSLTSSTGVFAFVFNLLSLSSKSLSSLFPVELSAENKLEEQPEPSKQDAKLIQNKCANYLLPLSAVYSDDIYHFAGVRALEMVPVSVK